MRIQLLGYPGCPNASAARDRLLEARVIAGVEAEIEEIDTTFEATPKRQRGWGSPTVLIDGADVAGENSAGGGSCRIHCAADGRMSGVPPLPLLVTTLRHRGG